jgi:hypothetical protein
MAGAYRIEQPELQAEFQIMPILDARGLNRYFNLSGRMFGDRGCDCKEL